MHPSRQELSDFAVGSLNEESFDQVADHVDTCAVCGDTVRELESAPCDPLIREIRSPRPEPEFEHEPECEQLLELVQAIRLADSHDDGPSPSEQFAADNPHSLGSYQILEKLGQGGMGAVYKARHAHLDRLVAIKLLPPDRLNNAGIVNRFRREMKAVGRFSHPNIVQATDAGEAEGRHYLVMELVDGIDVARLAKRCGPLSIADACEIVRQAAVGVAHAHQHGMVHRDIKPANLMLTRTADNDIKVKVLDLGLALLYETETGSHADLTGTGQIMGTVEYMAPEQGSDSHDVDRRADIYSLGATLYKLLSGKTPFPADRHNSTLKLMMAKASGPAPSLAEVCDGIPAELVALVDRMIARDPDERIPSAQEVATALAPFAAGHDLSQLLEAVSRADTASDTGDCASIASDRGPVDVDMQAIRPTVTPDDLPTPVASRQPVRDRSHRRKVASLLVAGLGLVVVLALATFYFQTAKGTLVVEIHDDQVEVIAANGEIRITKHDKSGESITVKPGRQMLHVTHGDLQFDTDQFTLRRGDTVTVSVRVMDGEVRVLRGGEIIGRKRLPRQEAIASNADRRAAKWALQYKDSKVTLITAGRTLSIQGPSDDLPETPFRLVGLLLPCHGFENDDEAIRALRGCTSLTHLTLVQANLSDKAYEETIATLSGLEYFTHHAGGVISDVGLEQLAKLKRLEHVGIEADQVTSQGIQSLRRLPKLKSLTISGMRVDPQVTTEVAQLKTLEIVGFHNVRIGEIDLESLKRLPNLKWFSLDYARNFLYYNDKLNEDHLSHLRDFSKLQTLILQSPVVTDDWLSPVTSLKDLRRLELSRSGVTGDGLRHLSGLPKLDRIDLSGSALKDEGLRHIPAIRMLYLLDLQQTEITDAGLRHLHGWRSKHPNAIDIQLQQTQVTVAGVAALKAALPPDARIESDFTDGEIEAAMAKLKADAPQVP